MPNAPRYRRRYKVVDKRPTAAARGYDSRWQEARREFLRSHPLCAKHFADGKLVPAMIVDHVVPHKGDYKLFWDRNNWQSLCKRCHDYKTATEDGGFGRPIREASKIRQFDESPLASAVCEESAGLLG